MGKLTRRAVLNGINNDSFQEADGVHFHVRIFIRQTLANNGKELLKLQELSEGVETCAQLGCDLRLLIPELGQQTR